MPAAEHDEVENVLARFDAARAIPLPAPTAASVDPTLQPFGALPTVKAVEVNDDELVHGEDELIELKELPPDDPASGDP